MAASRSTVKILRRLAPYLGMAAVNGAVFATGVKTAQRNHEAFLALPRNEQRELYDKCPLNKLGTSNDGIAAIRERFAESSPNVSKMQPTVPFDEAYPDKSASPGKR